MAKIRMRQLKSWRKSKRNTRRGWGIEACNRRRTAWASLGYAIACANGERYGAGA
jgi:hypothetical protein